MRNAIYLFLAILLLATRVTGQKISTNQPQDDRVFVGTKLVTVNVIVTDGHGHYVQGLSENQFTVYDDKVKQQIAHFSSEPSPFSIAIVCEVHESTPEQTRKVLAAVKHSPARCEAKMISSLWLSASTAVVRVRASQAHSNLRLSYRKGYQLSRDQ